MYTNISLLFLPLSSLPLLPSTISELPETVAYSPPTVMEVVPRRDGRGLEVEPISLHDSEQEIETEFRDESVTCLVRFAALFATGEIGLDAYLDGVLGHLRPLSAQSGIGCNVDDTARVTGEHVYDVDTEDVANFLEWDLLVGCVKGWLQSESWKSGFDDNGKLFPDFYPLAFRPGTAIHYFHKVSCSTLVRFTLS
jgi:hypothetical protein